MKRYAFNLTITLLTAAGIVLSMSDSARAQGAVSQAQMKERIDYIQNILEKRQPGAQAWWYGWIGAYSAGTIVQGALADHHWYNTKRNRSTDYRKLRDRAFAEDMLIGAGTSFIGVVGMFIDPFTPAYAPNLLRKMPAGTNAEVRAKFLRAESLLRRCAQREKDGWGWLTHMLNLGVNIAAGLITVLAFDRPWTDGLINFATGQAISLVNIFTQPRKAIKDLEEYEKRYLLGQTGGYGELEEREWFVTLAPGGLMMGVKF
jgi:hypothetical protein